MRCARRERSRRSSLPSSAVQVRSVADISAIAGARAPLRCDRDGVRHAPDPGGQHGPPSRERALVRGLPARAGRQAAPDRLCHVRGRHRRRHGEVSRCGVREEDGSCSFEKQGPTVSYGGHADDLFVTLRRSPDAEPGDQVIVLDPEGAGDTRADGHLGSTRNARHVLARLHDSGDVPGGAGPADAVLSRGDRVDGAALAHPLVAALARHRNRCVRSCARTSCARRRSSSPASLRLPPCGCRI